MNVKKISSLVKKGKAIDSNFLESLTEEERLVLYLEIFSSLITIEKDLLVSCKKTNEQIKAIIKEQKNYEGFFKLFSPDEIIDINIAERKKLPAIMATLEAVEKHLQFPNISIDMVKNIFATLNQISAWQKKTIKKLIRY
jgi:hypothetical protein